MPKYSKALTQLLDDAKNRQSMLASHRGDYRPSMLSEKEFEIYTKFIDKLTVEGNKKLHSLVKKVRAKTPR